MARSLSRNTKLFVSTVDIIDTTPTSANTFEVKILDGYSFSQGTSSEDITVDEAGCTTVRGTQSFNTALNPAEVSFSVYARPDKFGGTDTRCPEDILWNAAFSDAVDGAETQATDTLAFDLDTSNTNELLTLILYFKYENTVYKVTNFSVDQVEVDFSIDAIASMTFSGSGSDIVEDQAAFDLMTTGTWVADSEYRAAPAADSSSFLRNKLSTVDILDQNSDTGIADVINGAPAGQVITLTTAGLEVDAYAGGRVYNSDITPTGDDATWATIVSNTATDITVSSGDDITNWATSNNLTLYLSTEHAGITYNIPITGGSLTFANNMTYLTPEELAIVNRPLAGFTGGRTTSGTLTAYLNTGAEGSGGLLDDLLRKITEVNNNYSVTVHMGECGTTDFQVQFAMPHCNVGIPTTSVEDIISTEITFVAQEWDTGLDIPSFEDTNSLVVTYIKT